MPVFGCVCKVRVPKAFKDSKISTVLRGFCYFFFNVAVVYNFLQKQMVKKKDKIHGNIYGKNKTI